MRVARRMGIRFPEHGLVFPWCGVLERTDHAEPYVNEIVLKAVELMRDKGNGMDIAIRVCTTGELKNLEFCNATGVVANSLRAQLQNCNGSRT
jgi:hypothetical protein